MNLKTIAIDPGYGSTKVRANGNTSVLYSAVARIKEVGLAAIGMKTASQAQTIQLG